MSQFVLPVRVYLEDTDAQGVVYNASYFRYLERARTEWLRAHGVEHNRVREQEGVISCWWASKSDSLGRPGWTTCCMSPRSCRN